jgi:hypothetical protein
VWTADTDPAQRADWLADLEVLRGLGTAKVVAGHRTPGWADDAAQELDFTSGYLRDFDARLAEHPDDPQALVDAVNATYAELTLPALLHAGAEANTGRPGSEPRED